MSFKNVIEILEECYTWQLRHMLLIYSCSKDAYVGM